MTMREFRRLAAAMDLRFQQLTAEGVQGPAIIECMVGHLPDLQKIWVGTSDNQLTMLCNEFPGFRRYASLMEEAAEAEHKKPSHPYDGVPELPDSLKDAMAALLVTAATHVRHCRILYCRHILGGEGFCNQATPPQKTLTEAHGWVTMPTLRYMGNKRGCCRVGSPGNI
jgi:hypothetical protein